MTHQRAALGAVLMAQVLADREGDGYADGTRRGRYHLDTTSDEIVQTIRAKAEAKRERRKARNRKEKAK